MMNNLEEELRKRLVKIKEKRGLKGFALTFGLEQSSLSRFTGTKKRKPETGDIKTQNIGIDIVEKLLDIFGARVIFPDQQGVDGPALPALTPSPDNDALHAAISRIQDLERKLDEKDKQLNELVQYKHRWEGLVEIETKKMTATVQAQQQKNMLLSSAHPPCAGREPEARERLNPGGNGPPEHSDSVGDGI